MMGVENSIAITVFAPAFCQKPLKNEIEVSGRNQSANDLDKTLQMQLFPLFEYQKSAGFLSLIGVSGFGFVLTGRSL